VAYLFFIIYFASFKSIHSSPTQSTYVVGRLLRVRRSNSTKLKLPMTEMMLSGSRGIGSVAFNDMKTIDIFDLEEDEDSDTE